MSRTPVLCECGCGTIFTPVRDFQMFLDRQHAANARKGKPQKQKHKRRTSCGSGKAGIYQAI